MGALNAACGAGNCGKLTCASDKNSLNCTGANPNACGGCNTLTPAGAVKDASCGTCGRKYACNPDKNSLSCVGTMPNVCGGCAAINGTVGASCGACSKTACASDKESLDCKLQCTGAQVCTAQDQCKAPDCSAADSCGKSNGAGGICTNSNGKCPIEPNANGTCSGSSCTYVCPGLPNVASFNKTLSCSTIGEPACGSWSFETGTAEGWTVIPHVDNAVLSGPTFPAPPGGSSGYGQHSLALKIDGTRGSAAGIRVYFCPGNGVATNISGVFHAMVWWEPSDSGGGLAGPGFTYISDGSQISVDGPDSNTPEGQWFDLPSNLITSGDSLVSVDVNIAGVQDRKGTLYFDNIYFD
ncbi:MAG TPA: hypothetical protein VIW29_23145 [Polyangiaceae bacterium]